VPKLGMGPIRRDQICRAAATVIAREGFAGSTMRMVAEEAGVSTGMLNHYFANRQHLLAQALGFVSERSHERAREAMQGIAPGRDRLEAFLDSMLQDREAAETWRVWMNAYGEALQMPELLENMQSLMSIWNGLISHALEGLVPDTTGDELPWSHSFDAILKGLAIQALTSGTPLDGSRVRGELERALFPHGGHSPQLRVLAEHERMPARPSPVA
jgi:AcrR family transcriptional regulator